MNWYTLLANLVVFFHLLYVAFVVVAVPVILLGGWLKWSWVRNFWFRIIHFVMMLVVVVESLIGMTCPMTTWEQDLRWAGGQIELQRDEEGNILADEKGLGTLVKTGAYRQDFVARCLQSILFFDAKQVPQWVLNCCYYSFGVLILLTLILVPPRWPWKKAAAGYPLPKSA
jgi:hypothetical protein